MEASKINLAPEQSSVGFSPAIAGRESSWAPEELEELEACPSCTSPERMSLHSGVIDRVYFSSKHPWNLWRCTDCGCAYLSPRPNRSNIGKAYSTYYTHTADSLDGAISPLKATYRS